MSIILNVKRILHVQTRVIMEVLAGKYNGINWAKLTWLVNVLVLTVTNVSIHRTWTLVFGQGYMTLCC